MPANRAGYTVTIFLVDVSPSMGKLRTVELPPGPNGEERTREFTRLEWVLEFVMLKVQEMIFHGRKTEQCGVILFGTEYTQNVVNENNGGYDHVTEFIPIGQPNAQTMTKIKSIKPSTAIGDPIDSLIVGIETQARYLAKKPTWTRRMVLLTDAENPMEIEDWETTVKKMNDLEIQTSIIGVDFDDEYMPFYEENKPMIKRTNEEFYQRFSEGLNECVMGTAAFALQDCSKPDIKTVKSTLMDSRLRIGDVDTRPEEAIELHIKTSKCTAISRPPSMKKYAKRQRQGDSTNVDGEDVYTLLAQKTQYVVERDEEERPDGVHTHVEESQDEGNGDMVEKEDLVRGYKYGASFVPLDAEEEFQRLEPKPGIDICGFFPARNFRRDWSMGEVHYVWGDNKSAREQVAFSSIVQAMSEKQVMAIARWAGRSDPKMGVMMPRVLDDIDCFLWVQVPFADDLRKFTFRSLDQLVSKKGEVVTKHAHLPTDEQMKAMETFVDAMDLMHAGDKDENGNRIPWFDPVQTYNPAVHRIKQALFHGAITSDLSKNPLPPPHPDLTKYFDPPPRVLKRAHDAIKDCKSLFKVKQAPPKTVKRRKDGHVPGEEDDGDILALAAPVAPRENPVVPSSSLKASPKKPDQMEVDSATDVESDEEYSTIVNKPGPSVSLNNQPVLDAVTPAKPEEQAQPQGVLPTPARSPSPASPPIDAGRALGRIIGNISPLEDFRRNIKEGDVVTQAVHDLGEVIKEVITKPFSSRRHPEMLECLKDLRNVALHEDEISAWNAFLRDLKDACLNQTPNNQEFWAEIQSIGRPMSLISSKEAKKLGGKSDVTEGTAVDFIEEEE
ncbi:SPOC domain-like protein [Gautieria morchelliformis]|nr:SPOC domain-like protein [Gautieria morchelliformis]